MAARYCPPIRGTWQPENGAVLTLDFGERHAALTASLCRTWDIPWTSKLALSDEPRIALPLPVLELIGAAVAAASRPARRDELMAEARRLLFASAEREFSAREQMAGLVVPVMTGKEAA